MSKKQKLVQRIDFIKEMSAGKKVLHLGCTNYPYTEDSVKNEMLLHFDLGKTAKELYGFDFDQEGLDILSNYGVKNLYQADLEKLDEVALDETFDVIIAGEMIEHLSNPGLFLKGIKRFMNQNTKLVITTINAYCAMRFLVYALRGKGGSNEPVHPDHVFYYSYSTLNLLLRRENYTVEQFLFYDLGEEHRPHAPWHYKFINDIAVRVSPQLCDGIIAVCHLPDTQ
jgi:SAM-dependent methyltransferase